MPMKKREKEDFRRDIDFIKNKMKGSDEIRRSIFFGPKNIEKIRMWFKYVPNYQLDLDELEQIKKYYKTWDIFNIIIKTQKVLSADDIISFYKSLRKSEQYNLWLTMMTNTKISMSFKLEVLEDYLAYNHRNYPKSLINVLEKEYYTDIFWKEAIKRIIDYINEDGKHKQYYVDAIKYALDNSSMLDHEFSLINKSSEALYLSTERAYFLAQEAKDIFLF